MASFCQVLLLLIPDPKYFDKIRQLVLWGSHGLAMVLFQSRRMNSLFEIRLVRMTDLDYSEADSDSYVVIIGFTYRF